MEAFMAWLKSVNDVVWGPGMLVLLVGTGLYLTCLLYTSDAADEL